MRFIFLGFAIFFCNCSIAQIRSGELNYSLIRKNIISKEKTSPEFSDIKKQIFDATTKLKFYLKFNDSLSRFGLLKSLPVNKEDHIVKMAILSTKGNSTFLFERRNNTLIEETEFGGDFFLIKSRAKSLNWKLTKETKTISGFLCYKATTELIKMSVKGKELNHSYTAWYSPSIPFSYGPFNIIGLPGLVLEFSDNTKIFTANLVYLSEDNFDIKPLRKGKIVSKIEFDDLMKNAFENSN